MRRRCTASMPVSGASPMVVAEVEEDRLVVTERTKVFGLFMRILTGLLLIDMEGHARWDLEDGKMHLTVTPSRCELTDIGGFT